MKRRDENLEKYVDDISTIKSLLLSVDEKPIIDNWAFFVYGIFFFIGSIIHGIGANIYQLNVTDLLFKAWAPVMMLSMFFETMAWMRRITRESLPVFSRSIVKFFLAASALSVIMIYFIHILLQLQAYSYLVIILLMFFGVFMLLYAMVSYTHLCFVGYFFIILGFILKFIDLNIHIQFITAGIAMSIAFIIAGILGNRKEKENAHE